jgi:hypothetical protein
MATITNNTNKTFSHSAQQAIRNAAANCGVDEVTTSVNSNDGNNDTLFDLYDTNENYLFSIDTDGDVIFEA